MSELTDNRPCFTIVMGCNGVGKSAWKRANYVPVLQCVVELGKVREWDRLPSDEMASWCASIFERIERDARMRAERTGLAEEKK